MTERGPLYDQNETPEDVATLYSWANLHGAKYRDFSESARKRERKRGCVCSRPSKRSRLDRISSCGRTGRSNLNAPQRRHAWKNNCAKPNAMPSKPHKRLPNRLPNRLLNKRHSMQQNRRRSRSILPSLRTLPRAARGNRLRPTVFLPIWLRSLKRHPRRVFRRSRTMRLTRLRPSNLSGGTASQPERTPQREDNYISSRNPWAQSDQRENAVRPAWLAPPTDEAAAAAVPRAPEDTLQGSRDRLASRWYALRGVFEGGVAPVETAPAAPPARAPVVAVFSLAGGVGKTSLVATLGRALSARGERVLLVDTAAYGLMPFFFGAHDQRPGVLRTFSPPGTSGDAPIQMITLDPESLGSENGCARGSDRGDRQICARRKSRHRRSRDGLWCYQSTHHANGAAGAGALDSRHELGGERKLHRQLLPAQLRFDRQAGAASLRAQPVRSLSALHLDIREVLREQLGERLLPFVLRRAPAVSEALAEGMTVMDYAPNSTLADDFGALAGWVKSHSARGHDSYRGVRWSER